MYTKIKPWELLCTQSVISIEKSTCELKFKNLSSQNSAVYINIWLCTLEMNSSVHKARKYQWSLRTIIFVVSMQFLCEIDKQNYRASERLRPWIDLHMIK